MDITTLSLPIRRDRAPNSLFAVTPAFSSVNVSYETAEGQYNQPAEHSPRVASALPAVPGVDTLSLDGKNPSHHLDKRSHRLDKNSHSLDKTSHSLDKTSHLDRSSQSLDKTSQSLKSSHSLDRSPQSLDQSSPDQSSPSLDTSSNPDEPESPHSHSSNPLNGSQFSQPQDKPRSSHPLARSHPLDGTHPSHPVVKTVSSHPLDSSARSARSETSTHSDSSTHSESSTHSGSSPHSASSTAESSRSDTPSPAAGTSARPSGSALSPSQSPHSAARSDARSEDSYEARPFPPVTAQADDGPEPLSSPAHSPHSVSPHSSPRTAHAPLATPTRDSLRRARKRSSISIASAECQNFVHSLKEPKYAKPLSADEIAWIFQDFYRKLRQDVVGPADELLTAEEMEDRRRAEADIDSVLDRAERAVTGGELHQKLFSLAGHHDDSLQAKLDALRAAPALQARLREQLAVPAEALAAVDLARASDELNRIGRETTPKGKLAAIVKTLQRIGDELPAVGADALLPLFVLALTQSQVSDWWQNFVFIQRFRRSDALVGQAEYCLTSFEAAIHVLEDFTASDLPAGVDPALFGKPLKNPRAPARHRSASQSSRGSSCNSATAPASFSQRLGETLTSYKAMLVASSPRRASVPHPMIDQRFLAADADSLTLSDVRHLLKEYKRLAEYVDGRK